MRWQAGGVDLYLNIEIYSVRLSRQNSDSVSENYIFCYNPEVKEIEGIVCTAKSLVPIKQEWLFGPNTGESDFPYQTFTSNGLIPFRDISSALKVLEDIKRRKGLFIAKAGIAEIRLKIACSNDEMEQLKTSRNLIIIGQFDDDSMILLGRSAVGVPRIVQASVSDLEMNGFKTYKNFKEVGFGNDEVGVLCQVRRQGQIRAHLGTFELKRLKIK